MGHEFAKPPYILSDRDEQLSKIKLNLEHHNSRKPETKGICAASKKERRKCPIVSPSYESCHNCPFTGIKAGDINLGKEGLRGGIEDGRDSAAWRKNKLIHGIPHGDD